MPDSNNLLISLMQKSYLHKFIIFGGTALAFHLNHRPAIDLHLFTTEDFDSSTIIENLTKDFNQLQIVDFHKNSINSFYNKQKIDFKKYQYNFDFPYVEIDGIRIANLKDIAPMKIDAISARGKKKDFFDLYFLLQKFSLNEILELYQNKYHHSSMHHVLISLNYFTDAENNPEPEIFDNSVTWEIVKNTINNSISKL